jgi:hypothetical protein
LCATSGETSILAWRPQVSKAAHGGPRGLIAERLPREKNMAQRVVVITAADARYAELALGCIRSARDKQQGCDAAIAFFDLGCTHPQRKSLRPLVDIVAEPEWEFDFPSRDSKPAFLRGLLARPFLRRYFPGFDVYFWLDADAWVQDWTAVELFCDGALRRRGMALVPEIDRGSARQYGGLPEYWKLAAGWYAAAFGNEVAAKLHSFPMLNAGVFALHHEAPHWRVWEESIALALKSACTIMTDQLALNYSVYTQGLFKHTELLPAWCNWMCHNGFPLWHTDRQCLVEPYLPHTEIGILHLTTRDKSPVRNLATTDGQAIDARITYPARPVAS